MLDLLFKNPCWSGGCTKCNGSMQSKNNSNIHKGSLKDSENGSRKGQSLEIFSTEPELKDSDVQLRMIMHHGIPTTCCVLAYDPLQHMLLLATKDGHIKIFTDYGMERILQLSKQHAIQFLQVFNKQSILVCANVENVIEVWDTSTLNMIGSQKWNINITALGVIQDSAYFFVGDTSGMVTVIQYDREQLEVNVTAYIITLPQVFGDLLEGYDEKLSVKYILPQPSGEHERVLICYANGVCVLWALHDGEVIAVCAHTASALVAFSEPTQGDSSAKQLPANNIADGKTLTSACWCCGNGIKFATGYNDGDVWIWSIDQISETMVVSDSSRDDSFNCSSTPICKLKTGCLVPINVLRWWEKGDHKQEKGGFLCALGGKTAAANDVLKVISVNDACLSRSKCSVDLEVPEHIADCIPVHSMTWSASEARVLIMVLGSGGKLYAYCVDFSQSFKSPIPTETLLVTRPVLVDFNLSKSQVTKTKLILLRKGGRVSNYIMQVPRVFKPCLSYQFFELNKLGFTFDCKQTEYLTDLDSEACYLYLTGHEDGLVYLWDLSTQIMSVCGPQFQESRDHESILPLGDCPVSSLDFCSSTGLLAIGYANGLISLNILNLDNPKSLKAGQTDEGKEDMHALWSCISKFHTHKEPVSCIVISSYRNRLASGFENGMISLFDIETKTILYSGSCFQNQLSRIVSLNFVSVPTKNNTLWGSPVPSHSKKKLITFTRMERVLVTTKDSGILVLDGETGAILKTSPFKLKNPSNAISLHVIDALGPFLDMPSEPHNQLLPKKILPPNTLQTVQYTKPVENEIYEDANTMRNGNRQYLLLCSESALCIYSMPSSFKDACSSCITVKLNSPCQWASTFQTPDKRNGLALLYKTGKIEIRFLPSLNLLKSISPEGLLNWKIEPNHSTLRYISCTSNGHIALAKGDGELLVLSILDAKHDCRGSKLFPVSSNAVKKATEPTMDSSPQKKKKNFRKVIKATNVLLRISDKGNKGTSQKVVDLNQLFMGKSSIISGSLQSSHQFNDESHSESSSLSISSRSLNVDDIEIDDEDPPKDGMITPNRSKLIHKVKKNMKGKEKLENHDSSKVKSRMSDQVQKSDAELSPVHGPRTIDEIKAAYKQGKDHSVMGTAIGLKEKIIQQRHKLGEIERKTTDMQEGAQQFHKMAEELYKAIEEKNKRKFF